MLFFRKQENKITLQHKSPNVGIFLKDKDQQTQLHMIGLTEEDLQLIHAVKPYVEERIDEVVDSFYNSIGSIDHLRGTIVKHSTIDRLRQTLTHHVVEMFEARIDDHYLEKRRRVSLKHVHIGLMPKWYLGSFQNLELALRKVIKTLPLVQEDKENVMNAISKLCNFEQQIVLEEYERVAEQLAEEERNEVKNEVKKVIGTIANQLKGHSQDTNKTVVELISSTNYTNDLFQDSIIEAQGTKKEAKNGYEQLLILNKQTTELSKKIEMMTEMIQNLDRSSSQIQEVVEIVKHIAGQTHLLAINSAIEAVRAGQYGKGFSVVAEEVRKLADQTKKSVEQIAILIGQSNTVTSQVVDFIHQIQELVEKGNIQNQKSLDSFDTITDSVDSTIEHFESAGNQMEKLLSIVKNIGESSKELEQAAVKLDKTIETF